MEICVNGEWGTICADFSYNDVDAQVICRQLNIPNESEFMYIRTMYIHKLCDRQCCTYL